MKKILVTLILLASTLAFSQDAQLFKNDFAVSENDAGSFLSSAITLNDYQRAADHWQIVMVLDSASSRTVIYPDSVSTLLRYGLAGGIYHTTLTPMSWQMLVGDTLVGGAPYIFPYTDSGVIHVWKLNRSTSQTLPTDLDIEFIQLQYFYTDTVTHIVKKGWFSSRNTVFDVDKTFTKGRR